MGYYITFDDGSGAGKGTIVAWVEQFLKSQNKSIFVLKDNQHDPLRDLGARMIAWCEANRVDRQTFLFPLFVAGGKIVEGKLVGLLQNHDFVLRDRSFVTSLAYQPASGTFTQEQVWSLYIDCMGFRIPDLAIIVDAEVDVALARINRRKQQDIGLGGKMSGDVAKRQRIRELFLSLPERLGTKMSILVLPNNDNLPESENDPAVIENVGRKVLDNLKTGETP